MRDWANRAAYLTHFPIAAFASVSGKDFQDAKYQEAMEVLSLLMRAGQFHNDLRDITTERYSDIKNALVTAPLVMMHARMDHSQREHLSSLFGKHELSEEEKVWIHEMVVHTQVLSDASALIRGMMQKQNNIFAKINLADIAWNDSTVRYYTKRFQQI